MGDCLIFSGSGVLVRMRRDPHCDDGGVCLGVHSFGGDHHPSRLRGSAVLSEPGSRWTVCHCWAKIMPLDLVRCGQEVRSQILIGTGPRMVLSTAMTVLPSMVSVCVQNYDPRWASRSAGSRSWSIRRVVDSDVRVCPTGRP